MGCCKKNIVAGCDTAFAYVAPLPPAGFATEIRARLSLRLAELFPPGLGTFFFTLGGAVR